MFLQEAVELGTVAFGDAGGVGGAAVGQLHTFPRHLARHSDCSQECSLGEAPTLDEVKVEDVLAVRRHGAEHEVFVRLEELFV